MTRVVFSIFFSMCLMFKFILPLLEQYTQMPSRVQAPDVTR